MKYVSDVLKGIVIGVANAIPGVSGGTMMVIMKVFDKLLGAITLNLKKLKENLPFLIPIAIGMLIGVVLSAKVLTRCFDLFYVQTQLFFLGVILGSLPMIYNEGISKEGKFKPMHILPFIIGLGTIILVSVANVGSDTAQTELTVGVFIYLVIIAIISAAAMIMPGLSGSLVLLMLGGYQTTMQAIDDMNIPMLIPVAIGVILGFLICAKVITICLKKWYRGTYAVILGMIVGSLYAIFPRETIEANGEIVGANFSITSTSGIAGIVTCIIGILLPLSMMFIDKKKKASVKQA